MLHWQADPHATTGSADFDILANIVPLLAKYEQVGAYRG
jgi:hypothetical protein